MPVAVPLSSESLMLTEMVGCSPPLIASSCHSQLLRLPRLAPQLEHDTLFVAHDALQLQVADTCGPN